MLEVAFHVTASLNSARFYARSIDILEALEVEVDQVPITSIEEVDTGPETLNELLFDTDIQTPGGLRPQVRIPSQSRGTGEREETGQLEGSGYRATEHGRVVVEAVSDSQAGASFRTGGPGKIESHTCVQDQMAGLHDELRERTRRGAARVVVAAQKHRQLEHALVPRALVIQVDASVEVQEAGREQSRCPFRTDSHVAGFFYRGRHQESDAGALAVEVVSVQAGAQACGADARARPAGDPHADSSLRAPIAVPRRSRAADRPEASG